MKNGTPHQGDVRRVVLQLAPGKAATIEIREVTVGDLPYVSEAYGRIAQCLSGAGAMHAAVKGDVIAWMAGMAGHYATLLGQIARVVDGPKGASVADLRIEHLPSLIDAVNELHFFDRASVEALARLGGSWERAHRALHPEIWAVVDEQTGERIPSPGPSGAPSGSGCSASASTSSSGAATASPTASASPSRASTTPSRSRSPGGDAGGASTSPT